MCSLMKTKTTILTIAICLVSILSCSPAAEKTANNLYDIKTIETKMKDYFPFKIIDSDGQHSIVAETESPDLYPKYSDLFEKYGYSGNGYSWEGRIKQILEKLDKELINHITFDPEAGGFFAIADSKESQLKFVETLCPIFSDLTKLENYIKNADRSRIDD